MCKERSKFQAKLEADRRNFQQQIEEDCQKFQLEFEKYRQEFQTYLENIRQQLHLEVNKINAELQRELSAQNHAFRLEEINANFELTDTYSRMYSQTLSITDSSQLAANTIQAEDIRFLVDSKKIILHELRLIYALTVKYCISAEEYLHYLDESIRFWVDLRTDKSAEEFLQQLVDNNGEVDKYFSDEDKRYFIKLCDAYYENEQKTELGNICLKLSVYVDGKAAVRYYREAAEQGDIYAQRMLGSCYYNTKDYADAIEWYRLAVECGRPGAEAKANAVEQKLKEREERQKADEAFAALHEVAEQGDAEAQFELGELYYKSGAYLESINWYRKAAEQGHAGAQYVLGGYY